jgi:hypothetical protein
MISDSAAAQSAPDSATTSLAGRFLHIAPNQDIKSNQANGNSEPKQAAGRNFAKFARSSWIRQLT